jgi:hypothetical protein
LYRLPADLHVVARRALRDASVDGLLKAVLQALQNVVIGWFFVELETEDLLEAFV